MRFASYFFVAILLAQSAGGGEDSRISVLMLGDQGHHRPAALAKVLKGPLKNAGIDLTYTEDIGLLHPAPLAKYDCLLLYNNIDTLPPREEQALVDYVEGGGGLVVVHCSAGAFRNSSRFTALMGGQFHHHKAGVFQTHIIDAQHPAMRGLKSFSSWDETYVHRKLAKDNRVLMVRDHQGGFEPWTWVREQGQGRVFYTASGHNEKTWNVPGFQQLVAQGIKWAAGRLNDQIERTAEWKKFPQPLSPEESMKHMHVPEGFRVELFASEADILQTIAMNFDERGRLWILESPDYPNALLPNSKGHDRIRILEDTNGDGKADKFKIFARGLNIPSAITVVDDGVIVANSPDIMLLRDTNGDDMADERKVLYTGLGRKDTHAIASNFTYGLDNWIWGCVGYSGGEIESQGETQQFGQGIFRFRPDGSRFEFLSSTSNNTWGLGFNESGDVFASTANHDHSIHMGIPNRYIESVRGWHAKGNRFMADHRHSHPIVKKVRQRDFPGSYTSATNATVYTARNFPRQYWNRAKFVCEPPIHLIHVDLLTRDGSDFVSRDGYNFMASDDPYTAPVQALVGPDGALWVLDWYSYNVLHNNPDYTSKEHGSGNAWITNQRDLQRCRIYRIVYEDPETGEPQNLSQASPDQLVDALKNENMFWRFTAQRLLVERGKKDVLPQLAQLVSEDSEGRAAVHALWTLEGLGAFHSTGNTWDHVLATALTHPAASVRRAAMNVMPKTAAWRDQLLSAGLLEDKDPLIRKDALLALSTCPPSAAAGEAIAELLMDPDNAGDRWISMAATIAGARNDVPFLIAAATKQYPETSREAVVESVRTIAEHYARGRDASRVDAVISAFKNAEMPFVEAVTSGFLAGWPKGHPPEKSPKLTAALVRLIKDAPLATRTNVLLLAEAWGIQGQTDPLRADLIQSLFRELYDEQRPEADRIQAARRLVQFDRSGENLERVLAVVTPRSSPDLTEGIFAALQQSDMPAVATSILDRWEELMPTARQRAMDVLVRRVPLTEVMLTALQEGRIDVGSLTVEQAQQLALHSDANVARRAKQLLADSKKLPDPDREKIVKQFMHLADKKGDLAQGKLVYEKNCGECHTLHGVGGKVGPDLTGIGQSDRHKMFIDILDPNRAIEGNYRQWQVTTEDGLILSGRLMDETKTSFTLYDTTGKAHVVLRENVDEMHMTGISVMPEGFEKLPPEELTSLLEYLATPGSFIPLDLASAVNSISTRPLMAQNSHHEKLVLPRWGSYTIEGVPFHVIDPSVDTVPNVIALYGPHGDLSQSKPKSVSVPCNRAVETIHLLSGVSGYGYPTFENEDVTVIVRLHYADGTHEDHPLINGIHFADLVRDVDVPGSKIAIRNGKQQVRYLSIVPRRRDVIERIELVKGPSESTPVVVAITVESAK